MDININANDMAKQLTVRVNMTGVSAFRARLLVGKWLIRLGIKVIGCGIRFDE